jgi:hypothetical protein
MCAGTGIAAALVYFGGGALSTCESWSMTQDVRNRLAAERDPSPQVAAVAEASASERTAAAKR